MPNVDRSMRLRSTMANNATPNTQRSGFNNPSDRKEMHVPVRRYCLSNSGLDRAPRKPGRATVQTLPNLSAMAARRGGGIGIHDFRSQAAHSAVFAACAMRRASARAVAMCAYRHASQEPPRSPARPIGGNFELYGTRSPVRHFYLQEKSERAAM